MLVNMKVALYISIIILGLNMVHATSIEAVQDIGYEFFDDDSTNIESQVPREPGNAVIFENDGSDISQISEIEMENKVQDLNEDDFVKGRSANGCPGGWRLKYGDSCYKIVNDFSENFDEATSFCSHTHHRAHLISIETNGELNYIIGHLTNGAKYWTSGYRASDDRFFWYDRETLVESYMWCRNQPDNTWGKEDRVELFLWPDWCFNDNRRSRERNIICEVEL